MPGASPRGTYLIVADAVRTEIRDGEIGDRLPSEAALMRAHGVSRTTVRRALAALAREGLIESTPGVGWQLTRDRARPSLVKRMTGVITEDGLSIGAAFPSEADLCERFGVSRPAVRSALAQMEGAGLLASAPGRRRTVRALPESAAHGPK